jgi:hypothetical protein
MSGFHFQIDLRFSDRDRNRNHDRDQKPFRINQIPFLRWCKAGNGYRDTQDSHRVPAGTPPAFRSLLKKIANLPIPASP